MKFFERIEHDVFRDVEQLQTSVEIVGDAPRSLLSVLAALTEDLQLNAPISLSVTKDDEGSIFYCSPSPIAAAIVAAASDSTGASPMQEQIDDHRCRALVSFPERLANKIANGKNTAYEFNAELYWERLSDALLLFYFACEQHAKICSGTLLHRNGLLKILAKIVHLLFSRGNDSLLLRRLQLLPQHLFLSAEFSQHFFDFMCAVYEASQKRKFSTKSQPQKLVSQHWHRWNLQLLCVIGKRPELKKAVVDALNGVMNDFSSETTSDVARALFDSFFVHNLIFTTAPRSAIRVLFKDMLGVVRGKAPESNDKLSEREESCFRVLFQMWDDKRFVASGDLQDNLTLLHPVMYALLYVHTQFPNRDAFPPKFVAPLLNGVSLRLDSTRGAELRAAGMAVAAAFATLFVNSEDTASPLVQDANFSQALETWMKGEPDANQKYSSSQRAGEIGSVSCTSTATFFRRATTAAEVFPLDPEEKYSFFGSTIIDAERSVTKAARQDASLSPSHGAFSPAALPAFGQQRHAKDELGEHVSILKSIRECYNALVGVGRGPNAQLHEVQEATESGLRGLADAFSKLQGRVDSDLFRSVSKETGPLIPTLLPTLISLSIHAPEDEKQFLLQLRYDVLVKLIVLNPVLCANQLSGMLYRSNYGIYQRNELIKAIGEAALFLSAVEMKSELPKSGGGVDMERAVGATEKRIYPPIPTHQLSSAQKTAIVVTEGQQTRRWGNADLSRARRREGPRRYTNYLGEVAGAFVAAFLFKLDADHFAFFQETDPYTPCAILDSLTMIFQGITNVRHVAPELCEKNFDFFFVVATKHPNLAVRQAAWTSTVEVMRTWCGVGPLWIRRKDGQRVLNRDASRHRSLMFTKSWLSALELLQHTCQKMLQGNDACGRTALIAVATLRDLVSDRDDFHTMMSQAEKVSFDD